MGKEEKAKDILEEIKDVNVESINSIEENLKKGATMNEEALNAAAAAIEKERKDILAAEAKTALCMCEFLQEKQLLILKKKRREAEADKRFLETIGKDGLHKELAVEKKLTPAEFREKYKEADKKLTEDYKNIDKLYREYIEMLKNKYRNYYTLAWDQPNMWDSRNL